MASSIDEVVRALLYEVGLSETPPVDVETFAQRLGVRAVEECQQFEDGRLELDGEARIYLRENLGPGRRRFTIAHELGHLLLLEETRTTAMRATWRKYDNVERMCDEIAAAILMPRDWLIRRFGERPKNLSTARHVSQLTGTSLSAAVARLDELLRWNKSLLRWKKESGQWRFVAGAAVPPRLHGLIGSADATSAAIEEVANRSSRDLRATLPIEIGGVTRMIGTQISVRGASAMALAGL